MIGGAKMLWPILTKLMGQNIRDTVEHFVIIGNELTSSLVISGSMGQVRSDARKNKIPSMVTLAIGRMFLLRGITYLELSHGNFGFTVEISHRTV